MAEVAACVATNFSPLVGLSLDVPGEYLQAVIDNPDTVQAALALARLDFISALLASIGVLLAFAGVFAFFSVRVSAKKTARDAAVEEIENELPKLLPGPVVAALRERPDLVLAALRHEPALLVGLLNEARAVKDSLLGDMEIGEADNIAESIEGSDDQHR